jgi:hypothetical protein
MRNSEGTYTSIKEKWPNQQSQSNDWGSFTFRYTRIPVIKAKIFMYGHKPLKTPITIARAYACQIDQL